MNKKETLIISVNVINTILQYLDNSVCPHRDVKELIKLIQDDVSNMNKPEQVVETQDEEVK